MRLSLKIPALVLGVPLPESENPYIAAPVSRAVVDVYLKESKSVSFELVGEPPRAPLIRGSLSDFWKRLCDGMNLRYEARVRIENLLGSPGPSGTYATLTVALLHTLAREHGETLDEFEMIEMGRLADPFRSEPPWSGVIDALRFSSATGEVVAYRNEEEAARLGRKEIDLRYETLAPSFRPRITREALGGELYSALIKLAGLEVLEAAVKLREGEEIEKVIKIMLPIQESLALGVWNISPRRGFIPLPGLPNNFEYYKLGETLV